MVNARMRTLSAAAGLTSAFHSIQTGEAGPAWIGYAMPVVPGNHAMCCNGFTGEFSEEGCGRCRLESYQREDLGHPVNPGGKGAHQAGIFALLSGALPRHRRTNLEDSLLLS